MTIQEEIRMRAEQLNAVANAIAASDTIDPNGELSMRVRCAMRDIDRAARALDAAEKEDQVIEAAVADAFDSWGPHPSAQNIVDKIRAALAEIRGGK